MSTYSIMVAFVTTSRRSGLMLHGTICPLLDTRSPPTTPPTCMRRPRPYAIFPLYLATLPVSSRVASTTPFLLFDICVM